MSSRFSPVVSAATVLATLGASSAGAQCPGWSSAFSLPGTDRPIRALCSYDDGSGPALIVAGQFSVASGVACRRVATWRGGEWRALGDGLGASDYDWADSLAVFDDGHGAALFAGGWFTVGPGVNYGLARWNGTSWSRVNAFGAGVHALQVFAEGSAPVLYAIASDENISQIRSWNGVSGSLVGTCTGTSASFQCMAVYDDGTGPALYAGGSFNAVNGVHARGIARWNGSSWSAVGAISPSAVVRSLVAFDDGSGAKLYASGVFSSGASSPVKSLARWDGTAWTLLGPSLNAGGFGAMTVLRGTDGPALLAVYFDAITKREDLVRWDGAHMSRLKADIDGDASVILATGFGTTASLFAAGDISAAGGVAVGNIARWDGTEWSALDSSAGAGGTDQDVDALAEFDDGSGPALYVAGHVMSSAGGVHTNSIARWNGLSWSDVGIGQNEQMQALIVHDDGTGPALYAGGKHVKRWNGTHWSEVGDLQYIDEIYAFAIYDDGTGRALYAAGNFALSGSSTRCQVAKWDGAAWASIADTPSFEPATCLAVFDDGSGAQLFASSPTGIGPFAIEALAKWNGSTWSSVGAQLVGQVHAMTTFDDGSGPALYVGGELSGTFGAFDTLDGVARWSGTRWSPVTSTASNGLVDSVMSLAVFDDGSGPALYAGGLFAPIALAPGNFAKWTGAAWIPAGNGVNLPVHAMVAADIGAGPQLFVGGEFTTAGRYASSHIAAYDACR